MALGKYITLLVFFFSANHLMANDITIETTPGSTIYLNGSLFASLDKSEKIVVLSKGELSEGEKAASMRIESSGYKTLLLTLNGEMIDSNQPIELMLTPIPFWLRWSDHIMISTLLLMISFGLFLFLKQKNTKKKKTISKPKDDISLDTFDSYSLIEHIASGGISRVYKAESREGKIVALKVMTNFLNDMDMVGKFIGEGYALKNINMRFPNAPVVEVYDFGREDGDKEGTPYIAMELVDGIPLSKKIEIDIYSTDEKIKIIKQLTEALHATHSVDVLHRDISPDNVLVREGEDIKICLIDFGVAKHEVNWLKGTSYGAAYGKPEYMSPEQLSGDENIDYRSDYYSLGILAYTLFCGKVPFEDPNTYKVGAMHRNDPIPEMPDDVPENIQILIKKMMAKAPDDRPKSPSEIVSYLNLN